MTIDSDEDDDVSSEKEDDDLQIGGRPLTATDRLAFDLNITNKSYKELPEALDGKCLPACLMFEYYRLFNAHFLLLIKENVVFDDPHEVMVKWPKIFRVTNKRRSTARRGVKVLGEASDWLCDHLNYNRTGPFPMKKFIEDATNFLRIQVRCIDSQTESIFFRFPKTFDRTKAVIYLHIHETPPLSHCKIIQNLHSFHPGQQDPCTFCDKPILSYAKHICDRSKICSACHRFLRKDGDFVIGCTQSRFCERRPQFEKNTASVCPTCSSHIPNEDCKEPHQFRVCKTGAFCQECDHFVRDLKPGDVHNCEEKTCTNCFEMISADELHFCKMEADKLELTYNNIAVLNVETLTNNNVAACQQCVNLESAYLNSGQDELITSRQKLWAKIARLQSTFGEQIRCAFHQENFLNEEAATLIPEHPNYMTLMMEGEKRGVFDTISFCDFEMDSQFDCHLLEEELELPYLPSSLRERFEQTDRTIRQKNFNLPHFRGNQQETCDVSDDDDNIPASIQGTDLESLFKEISREEKKHAFGSTEKLQKEKRASDFKAEMKKKSILPQKS